MIRNDTAKGYRFAPGLRRCCWYVIATLPVFAALVVFYSVSGLFDEFPYPDRPREAMAAVLIGLAGFLMVLPLRWRLRVDEQGVWRRWLFRWRLWSWGDFSSGRILKLSSGVLRDPERPWWRRNLRLDWMELDDVLEVLERINEHYVLPPAPTAPDAIKIGLGFRRSMILDDDGVEVTNRGETVRFLWNQVEQVRVQRVDPVRRDFVRLAISLAGGQEETSGGRRGTGFTTANATSEEINEFFRQKVSPEHFVVSIHGDETATRENAEDRLEAAQAEKRQFPYVATIMTLILGAMLVPIGIQNGFAAIGGLAIVTAIVLGLMFLVMVYSYRQKLVEARRQLASLGEAEDESGELPAE